MLICLQIILLICVIFISFWSYMVCSNFINIYMISIYLFFLLISIKNKLWKLLFVFNINIFHSIFIEIFRNICWNYNINKNFLYILFNCQNKFLNIYILYFDTFVQHYRIKLILVMGWHIWLFFKYGNY